MLCPATSRLHRACNNSSSRQISTLTIGETCSRRSVTNRRWTSCSHLMDIFTLQFLSLTRTRLPSAAHSEGEGAGDLLPTLRLATGIIPHIDVFDRSPLVFACCSFKLPYPVACLHPRLTFLVFYFILFLPPRCLSRFLKLVILTSPLPFLQLNPREPCFFPSSNLIALPCLLSTPL